MIAHAELADPAVSLRLYAHVIGQEEGQDILYDPYAITYDMQATIVSYVSDPPYTEDGYARWLNVLKGRQGGASTTGALSFYPKVAYGEGVNAVIIADNQKRADALFERVMYAHKKWDESVRVEQRSTHEVRQFTTENNSVMNVLSGHGGAVGIGRSVDYFMGSEIPYWSDAATQFSLIYPAMQNRRHALMMLESTPAPLDEPSAQWWLDKCADAAKGVGRNLYAFFPFWDCKLNVRAWPKSRSMDTEETRLMERYGPHGLTLENLAFRRFTMDNDPEIRRNPDLFGVYFPFDDLTCWVTSGAGVIPYRIVHKHTLDTADENTDGYTEFHPPDPNAVYVIGVDPTGYGVRDHAAFQILEVWDDALIQVASYGSVTDPETFANILFEKGMRYNCAKIVVERNGVGTATLALLIAMKYKNIHYDDAWKPGMHKSNEEAWVSCLVDALLDKLKLYGKDTVRQIIGYRSDRLTERSIKSELLGSKGGKARRSRHHWDKVSALMVACVAAKTMPGRHRSRPIPQNVVLYKDMTWNQIQEYERRAAALASGRSSRPRYVRRRR